jgi:hypothetical protein
MYELIHESGAFGYNVDIKGRRVGPEVQSKYDLVEVTEKVEEVTEKVMNIQLGKTYKNRQGEILTATTNPYVKDYPWRMVNGSQFYNVTNEGYFVSSESRSLLDIESEVEEVMITEEQFIQWAKGKEFLTPDGQIVTFARVYKGLDFDWTVLPKWAQYIAMDSDGKWNWFVLEPTHDDCEWISMHMWGSIPTEHCPINGFGTWKNNCHKRP